MPTATKPIHTITLEYHLSELPTAQHKAGLAGLVLQIRNLHDREEDFEAEDLPVLDEVTSQSCRVTVTERSLQVLFNELYSAVREPWKEKKKRKKKTGEVIEPVKIMEEEIPNSKTGKTKLQVWYLYEQPRPQNPFLMQYLDAEIWQKLWRDLIYEVVRSRDRSRIPYKQRFAEEDCSEGAKVWKELERFEKEKKKNRIQTTEITGSLLLGAQKVTAERVGFKDRSDHSLLLHFWALTVLVYVPWLLEIDNKTQADSTTPSQPKGKQDGFALAIPEVCHLEDFCEVFPYYLEKLNSQDQAKSYLPRFACIDLPAQSALQFLSTLAELATSRAKGTDLQDMIQGVEYYHVKKAGQNAKVQESGRILTNQILLDQYNRIQNSYWSPLFRATLIKGLLRSHRAGMKMDLLDSHWWRVFEHILESRPHGWFIPGADSAGKKNYFPRDIRSVFDNIKIEFETRKENSMNETPPDRPLTLLIRKMIQNYVQLKAEDRTKLNRKEMMSEMVKEKTADNKPNKDVDAFKKEMRKVASQTFLEVRSRHGQDFSQYFVDVFGSVSQRSLLKQEDYLTVSQAVLNSPDDVRILVMLALSANS